MCDPGGVCGVGELGPHVILLLGSAPYHNINVFLQNSSDAITDATALCQTHVALLLRYCAVAGARVPRGELRLWG